MNLVKKSEFWLVFFIVFQVVVNIFWLQIDKTPPAWDQAAHLRSVVLANQYFSGRFWGGFVDLIRAFGGYPPLIYLMGGVWSEMVGVGVMQISLLNTLFFVGAMAGVYFLAIELWKDKWSGLLAAVVFGLTPVIYDISRNFLLDLSLTVWVVWGLWFWMKKNDAGWLAMLVLASLTKLNGFIYFEPMVLWRMVDERRNIKMWMGLVMSGVIYLAAVGWWWGVNWQNIYQYLTGLAGQGEKLTDPMNLFDWVTWIHYLRLFFLHQAGPILAIVAMISWAKMPKSEENKKLISWAILVYVIFTIIKNKDFRFTMPILPVVAVWLGEYLTSLRGAQRRGNLGTEASGFKIASPSTSLRIAMTCVFVFYLFFQYIENSFGWPIKKPVLGVTKTFLVGDVEWVGWDDYPVRAANGAVWPNNQIVKDMILSNGGDKTRVLILTDSAEINDNNLKLNRELLTRGGDGVLEMHSVYSPDFNLWQNFDVVLVGESGVDPAPFYATNLEYLKQARDFVWANQDKFAKQGNYDLPNGQKLFLFKILI